MPNHRRPRRAARLLAGALALLSPLLLPAAAGADGWIRGLSLTADLSTTPPTGFAGAADVGTDAAGRTSIAWVFLTPEMNAEVRLTRIGPDGSSAPPATLGATTDDPSIAVAPSGEAAVAWADANDESLQLATVAPDGSLRPTRTVATGPASDVDVGVSDSGDVVVSWTQDGQGLHVRRVAASGQLGPDVTVSPDFHDGTAQVAVARDGGAWAAWTEDVSGETAAFAARLTAVGALDGAPVQLSAAGEGVSSVEVVPDADSAVATWVVGGASTDAAFVGRLNRAGPVAGTAVKAADDLDDTGLAEAAPSADGGIDLVWTTERATSRTLPFPAASVYLRHVDPTGALTTARPLDDSSTLGSLYPRISAGSDGTATITWLTIGIDRVVLVGLQQRADRSTTDVREVATVPWPFALGALGTLPPGGREPIQVRTSRLGVATAAWLDYDGMNIGFETARLDGIAPKVDAVVPATVQLGSAADLSVNVTDDGGVASVWWEFGDDSGSPRAAVKHRYADPGTYTVAVTVTDRAGNTTTVTRPLTVLAPPPTANRAPAAVKVTKVSRKGAKVTVTGTLDKRAGGEVTVAYSQKVGRRSLSTRASVTVKKGRFTATLRLTGKLAKVRGGRAKVKVSYAGDADVDAGSASRTVTVPKAKKPKKRTTRR